MKGGRLILLEGGAEGFMFKFRCKFEYTLARGGRAGWGDGKYGLLTFGEVGGKTDYFL